MEEQDKKNYEIMKWSTQALQKYFFKVIEAYM